MFRTLDDVVEALRGCKENNRRCTVLIGAGCSKSAGIPLAGELVTEIKRAYPAAFRRAGSKDYPACMSPATFDRRWLQLEAHRSYHRTIFTHS